MITRLFKYSWLIVIYLLLGCSTNSNIKTEDVNSKLNALLATIQTLETRLDSVSKSVALIVNDGNKLHDKIDAVKTNSGAIQQKIDSTEVVVKNLDARMGALETNSKAINEDLKKQLNDVEKAEIELSNRIEITKLSTKEEVTNKATP